MSQRRLLVPLLLVGIASQAQSPIGIAGDKPHDRKGRFVRVYDAANIVVKRHNGEWIFSLLGVHSIFGVRGPHDIEREAWLYLSVLLKRQRIRLELDETVILPGGGREFAGYAYLKDGTCLNEEILRLGFGKVDDEVSFGRRELFQALQRAAQEAGAGIWDPKYSPASWLEWTPCPDGTIFYAGTCGTTRPAIIPTSRVQPEYPTKARRKGIQGRVVILGVIAADGSVAVATPVRYPDPRLARAASDAVARWRYRPATRDGRPIEMDVTIVVDFILTR